MGLRRRILLFLGASFLVFVVLIFVFSRTLILDSYRSIESESAERDVQRVLNAIQTDTDNLIAIVGDWASWDDTYNFLNGENADYVDTNLSASTLSNLGVHYMLFYDDSGQLFYGKQIDIELDRYVGLSSDLLSAINARPMLLEQGAFSGALAGVIFVNNQPHLVAARPILTNENMGPVAGTLIMGFPFDDTIRDDLGQRTRTELSFQLASDPEYQLISSTLDQPNIIHVEMRDNYTLEGYGLVSDLVGEPAFAAVLTLPRNIYQQGSTTLQYYLGMVLVAGLAAALGVVWQLDRLILTRLTRLAAEVQQVGLGQSATNQVTESGNDEVAFVAGSVNKTLAALNQTQIDLQNERGLLAQRVEERTEQLKEALGNAEQLGAQLTMALEQERLINLQRANFVKTVSHAFRTPMTSMGISTDLLIRFHDRFDQAKRNQHLERINAGVRTLTALLADAVEANSHTLEQVDVAPAQYTFAALFISLEEALLNELVNTELVTFAFDRSNPQPILTDSDRIQQLLTILVGNAVKFGLENLVEVRIAVTGEMLEIEVSDQGIGIPPAEIDDLFQLFGRTSNAETERGLGLGLYIAKQIVTAMGGSISAESAGENQGSTFTVTLPITSNSAPLTT